MKKNKSIWGAIVVIIVVAIFSLFTNFNNIITIDVGELPSSFSLEENSNLQILYFNVGQADSILIVDNGQTMLIDAGDNSDGKLLVEYIKQLGISKIDYLIGTHIHADHIGGMYDIINAFEIGRIYMPYVSVQTESATYRDVKQAIKDKNLLIEETKIGMSFEIGDADCIIKYVNNEEPKNLNNQSIIIEMALNEQTYLFMGDTEKAIENSDKIEWKKTNVLKVGHHGSDTSSSEKFIDTILPDIAIISVGTNNSYNHPSLEVINRLIAVCIPNGLYRTDKDDTIFLVNVNGKNIVKKLETKVDGNAR